MERSVALECVIVEGREKLFSSPPVVSNVMMKLNYDILLTVESQKTEGTLYLSYDTSVGLRPIATEGFGIHIQKSILSRFYPSSSTESNS
jgi:hypothetical protein